MFTLPSLEILVWIGVITGCASFVMCIIIIGVWLRNATKEVPPDNRDRWNWLDR